MTADALPSHADQPARGRIRGDLSSTLFVEAGAGTGKTTELVARIVRLVAAGHARLPQVAAITFTEAAAAELRDRVREELEKASRDQSAPEDERGRCREAVEEVDAAAIETLHSFSQRILIAHPLEAGLPPLFEVQDDVRSSIAFQERWERFMDELLDDPAMEETLLRGFMLKLDPKQLRSVAMAFHENWDRVEDMPAPAAPEDEIAFAPLLAAMREVCALVHQCTNPTDQLYGHLQRLDGICHRVNEAEDDLERLRVIAGIKKVTSTRGQKGNWAAIGKEEVVGLLERAEELRQELLSRVKESVLLRLIDRLRSFVLEYAEERRLAGRLEFHDLLVRARDLLRRDASVRQVLHDRFTHMLIDEFQDTDPIQIEIAVRIAASSPDGESRPWSEADVAGGRLFFVGDPKQSIYRFRRADIELYQAVQRRFEEQTVRLTQNFRSQRPVIDWVNNVFGELIGAEGKAGQAPYIPLVARAEQPENDRPSVYVLGGPAEKTVDSIREKECEELTRAIQSIKANGWMVTEKGEGGALLKRPARYADIAVLMPTRTPLPALEQALEEAGIPYRVESRSLVYNTQEVRDLLTILRAIDDPTDEVALIGALRSPAFACGDDDLLRFSLAGGKWDYRSAMPQSLPAEDHVVSAMTCLSELHGRRWWEPISGIVEAVIRERRLFELAFAQRRPRERWQRLRFVLDQARAFVEAGGATLRQFLDWAEAQAEEGTRVVETVVPEPDDDAVRITTIHAAKGLEFPIVALVGLNVRDGSQGRGARVLWNSEGRAEARIGPEEHCFQTPGFVALRDFEADMDAREKERLLYVAATRARDYLIVSLHHSTKWESHASRLHALCPEVSDLGWEPVPEAPIAAALPPEAPSPFDDSAEQREAWQETRRRRIDELSRAPVLAATAIARLSAAYVERDPNLAKDPPEEEVPPWRKGRAGTSLGRAVHAVLQGIDLATGEGLEEAARAQAAAEGVPGRRQEVARMGRAALASAAVKEAIGGRYWREVYVGVPVEGVTLEGFIDLLYETDAGLVIVDFKTDAVAGEKELPLRYRLQGAAYALAVERSLGRPVASCRFLFLAGGEAREQAISDLPAAQAEVLAAVKSQPRSDRNDTKS